MLSVIAQPAPAQAAVTGDGGQYVWSYGRVLDTRDGTGGFSTPMPANTERKIQVGGTAGVPNDASAVVLSATVVHPGGQGILRAKPDRDTPSAMVMVYGGGGLDTMSNMVTVPIGDDGKVTFTATTSVDLVLNVQGYYTSTDGGVAPGGFVVGTGKEAANTTNGTGLPQQKIGAGKSVDIQITGDEAGVDVPANASGIVANFLVLSRDGNAGLIKPYAAGGTEGSVGMNYPAATTSAMSAHVALSGDGKITVYNQWGIIDLVVEIQGYFTQTNQGGVFTPASGTLYDTRTGTAVPSGGTRAVQVAGQQGVPQMGAGVSAVAVTLTAINGTSSAGTATLWANGVTRPNPLYSVTFPANTTRSNTVIVPLGTDGKIQLWNSGPGAVNYLVDLQGWYNALPTGPGTTGITGSRPSATTLPFNITDQTSARVDVATGNLNVQNVGLTLPGTTSSVPIGMAYNSRGWRVDDTVSYEANRWEGAFAGVGTLSTNGTGVVYTDASGATWPFATTDNVNYVTPAGFKGDLVRYASGYTMTMWGSNTKVAFNPNGYPLTVTDDNKEPQQVKLARTGLRLDSITSTAGPAAARKASVAFQNRTTTITQAAGTNAARSIRYGKDTNGNLTSYTDATGKTTTFGYNGNDLTSITAPEGGVTEFTYDSQQRVTKIAQRNTTAGSPGTAITRISYASTTSTLVAGPRSDQNAAIADAKHTTYELNADTHLVKNATDAMGRQQSREYNPQNNGVTSSTVGTGSAASTTTGEYGANASQSLTKVQSSSGSASSATYGGASSSPYLADSSTDSAGNSVKMGYDPAGNMTSSSTGEGDNAATAKLERNDDGTVKTALAPGQVEAISNKTQYFYNSNKQLRNVTAPAETSIGAKDYTYDSLGRLATETDGRGNTTSFTYDNNDRLLSTAFSDGTTTVTNTYDGNGNNTSQVSATGTVTNTYDQQNRFTSTLNTAGGGQVSYGYDLAGNTVKVTDSQGTVTHDYDSSNALTATTYPSGAGTAKQLYKIDDHGRRTDTWLNATPNGGDDPTVWKAHQKLEYDGSGKVTRVLGSRDSSSPSSVVDTKYCYIAGTTAGGSCDPDKGNDRDQLQWSKDMTGQITEYDYKTSDGKSSTRLQKVKQTGGAQNTTWTFTYDKAGDRTEAKAVDTDTKRVISDTQLSFNALGQITTAGYQYDGTGNLIAAPGESFTYNSAQQMTSSTKDGVKTSYTYAGADMNKMLSQATDGGKAYQYTYGTSDSNGVPVITARAIAGVGTASVLSDPSSGSPLALRTTDGATSMWVIDGIGNPAAAITDKGSTAYTVSYSPYGGETVSYGDTSIQWQQSPYGFKSGIRSSNSVNGITKFGYRWQSAVTGMWIERDTLDAPLDPGNANRYAYAGDDPINNSDPTGRDFFTAAEQYITTAGTYAAGGGVVGGTIGCVAGGVTGAVGGSAVPVAGTVAGAVAGCAAGFGTAAEVGVGIGGAVGIGVATYRAIRGDYS